MAEINIDGACCFVLLTQLFEIFLLSHRLFLFFCSPYTVFGGGVYLLHDSEGPQNAAKVYTKLWTTLDPFNSSSSNFPSKYHLFQSYGATHTTSRHSNSGIQRFRPLSPLNSVPRTITRNNEGVC